MIDRGAYYNEIDPYAAKWLRNLIKAGFIAPGYVDERSIEDVKPSDLAGFTQCHFFAGIGIWPLALRRAGWPDSRPVWSGSCPCQPFSQAGKGDGFADERHLWPSWFYFVTQRRPVRIFGEQVAGPDGLAWLNLVYTDLEAANYSWGAVDLCAAGVGAPHIRQRLFWVADANDEGLEGRAGMPECGNQWVVGSSGVAGGMADANSIVGVEGCAFDGGRNQRGDAQSRPGPCSGSVLGGLADANVSVSEFVARQGTRPHEAQAAGTYDKFDGCSELHPSGLPGPTNGRWRAADWLGCTDEKWRPVEPGTFPLANGATSRVGRLRAYGNGLNLEATIEFIVAANQSLGE